MEERSAKIEKFLTKWDEMLEAANDIEEFKWRFEIGITSDTSIIQDRVRTINGINESFTKHNMTWNTSSR